MTTIAYDGRYIACDSRISCDGHVASNNIDKFYSDNKWVLFWSGAMHQKDKLITDFLSGDDFQQDPDSYMIGFERSTKKVFSIYVKNKKFLRDPIEWKDGQGSGSCYAIGAMDHGASAVEAIRIAASRDSATGGTINCFDTKTGKFTKAKC